MLLALPDLRKHIYGVQPYFERYKVAIGAAG